MKIAQLAIGAHDVQNRMPHGQQVSRQTRAVRTGTLDAKSFDRAELGCPCFQVAIPLAGCGDCHGAQTSSLTIDRDSNMVGFMGVNADDDLVHGCPFARMARAPIEEDRTVMVRNRQAPMRSHLARRRGNLMVDTSQERHVVTQGMSQAIKLQYHTHSQGSCPALAFSSTFQAGGIVRCWCRRTCLCGTNRSASKSS